MIRLSPHTMLVTAFYFLVWATQVSTPSHSDVTIRTVNVLPRVYHMLTISAPAPTHSQFVGIHHCDKPRVYEAWAASAVGFVNYGKPQCFSVKAQH
ncbi:unnamed protein product [Rhizoctonia solani]|uniref:Secreted protein n=1 Tax=Rhizoctonia solani TaxID=456999 RepID=A0A8H3DZA7_9AGAM|nr:unnamed protein product [Rhizoctonia solani]